MKKFVLKILPFIFLILAYGIAGEILLYLSKESYSIDRVSDIQAIASEELYYGREILGNSLSNYKFQMFRKKQPKVLVLGQSVTLQFRDFMFRPFQKDFYNTGLMARNAKDLNYVLDLIQSGEQAKPDLVLLGVDLSFFLENTFLDDQEWTRHYPEDRALSAKSHLKGMQRIFRNKNLLLPPEQDLGFGRAGMRGRGYRNDGTFRHEGEISRYLKDSIYRDGHLAEQLRQKRAPFNEPFNFDRQKEQLYYQCLDRFRRMGIELILYFPPYSDQFFSEAMQQPRFRAFWQEFMRVQEDLKATGYNVIEFSTPAQMGLNDHFMVDAEHPGEVLCALQLKRAVQSGALQGKYIDQLNFTTVDSLLASEDILPLSFMKDPVSKRAIAATRQMRGPQKEEDYGNN